MIGLLLQLAVGTGLECPMPGARCRVMAESATGMRQATGTGADSVPIITLAEALDRAVKLNPDYVRALGSVSEADWARKAARVAFLVPSISASLDYTKYSQAFFNIGTFQQSSTSSTFRLAGQYELFSMRKLTDLGRTQAELESATATEAQQRYAAALLTESAYYAVLSDGELAKAARDRAQRAEEQMRVARARVVSGAAVQSDSLTVLFEQVRSQVDQLLRESTLRVSRLELGRRVGIAGPVDAAPIVEVPGDLPLSLGEAIAQALEQGPEYRAARARERAANAALKGVRGEYFPTVTLNAAHNRFDENVFPNASNVSSISVSLSLSLWDNGARELRIIQSRTQRDVARAVRSDLERAALRDVTEAYDGYQTARAALELVGTGLAVARENYRVENARYQAGASTVVELITAQNSLSDAEAALVQARYAARLARARLEAILGARFATTQGGSQ
jgi:outer membrane protein TolC